MGLFQKKPETSSSAPLYSIGLNKTMLIVGLGNVGKDYDGTRHNIGFECVDTFATANDFPAWIQHKDLHGFTTSHVLGDTKVILLKPITLMNLSGESVAKVQHFYKLTSSQTIVVHDELDIPFGQIRTRKGGVSAGHNGIKSLLQHLEGDFYRVRIGIKNERSAETDSADFVLKKFSKEEQAHIKQLTNEVNSILTEAIYGGELGTDTRSFIV